MKALLIVAHGSRRAASNEEVEALAAAVEISCAEQFGYIGTAFLELAQPDIPTGIDRCIEAGADTVVVVPYFLAAGTHVANDIPAIIDEARGRHSHCSFELKSHIGASPMMAALVKDVATR